MNKVGTISVAAAIAGLLPLAAEAGTLTEHGGVDPRPSSNPSQVTPAVSFPLLTSRRVRVPIF